MPVRFIFDANSVEAFPAASFAQYKLNNGRRAVLSFDDTSTESVYFSAVAGSGWSGSLGASILGWSACNQSGSIVWQLQIEAVTPADANDMRSACSFATSSSVLMGVPSGSGALLSASIGPDDDAAAAGDTLRFLLTRLTTHSSDNLTGDADFYKLIIADGR